METQNWLIKQAQLNPDRLAVSDGQTSYTFAQLLTVVKADAAHLAGLTTQTRVGLLGKNNLLTYRLALALLSMGKTIVWLNWRLASPELAFQVADSELDLVLVDDALMRTEFDQCYQTYTTVLARPGQAVELQATFASEDIASIMYTSGTTGQPKGVLQTFGNHFASAIASSLNLGLVTNEQWLCVTPLFHISGFSIVMRGLVYGMAVRLMARFDPVAVEEVLATESITILSAVPYMLKQLLQQRQRTHRAYQPAFRLVLLGGGTIDQATLAACQAAHLPVVQCYGMTETCSQIIALSARDASQQLGAVGKPLFTTQVKLMPTTHEIAIKTPALTPGYLKQPAKFAAKMVDGWYLTGDIGHFNAAGFLYVDGRKDEMIISGGENIFPQEVEQVYAAMPGIEAVAVVGQADATWGQRPVAFIVGQAQPAQKLIDYGYAHLAHYKVPKEYHFVAALPKNASGKVQRFKLRQQLAK